MPRALNAVIEITARSLSEVRTEIDRKIKKNGNGHRPDVTRICTQCNLKIPAADVAVIFCDDKQSPEKIYDDHFRDKNCFRKFVRNQKIAFAVGEDPSDEEIDGLLVACTNHKEYNLMTPKIIPKFLCVYPEPDEVVS